MICFNVLINGKVICTAGVGEYGVLTSNLARVKIHPARRAKSADLDELDDYMFLSVGGLTSSESESPEHLRWLDGYLIAIGDEIAIRIVTQATCDEPVDRFCDETSIESP